MEKKIYSWCVQKSQTLLSESVIIFIDRIKMECYCTKTNLYSHEAKNNGKSGISASLAKVSIQARNTFSV
jgi:hypothetical protein